MDIQTAERIIKHERLFYQWQGKNAKSKRARFIPIEAGQRYIMGAYPNGYIYNTRIVELRRAGHDIVTVMEEVTNQFGEAVKRGRFVLIN